MEPSLGRLRGKIEIGGDGGVALGDTRIRLLEAIERHGSISQAAKAVPLSYKAAWDAIDAINNLSGQTLVECSTGGRHGGGSRLTDYGRQVVALYRAMEAEYQATLERVASRLGEDGAQSFAHFRQLIQRMGLKASARNQFAGRIVALREGAVDFEVRLQLDAETEIAAIITRESAENLGLAVGVGAVALVKSSSVLLTTDPNLRLTARNRLWGEVSRIHTGPVNAEVTLLLPGGKCVCAVVTHDSVAALGLEVGVRAGAVFKASAVILCAYES